MPWKVLSSSRPAHQLTPHTIHKFVLSCIDLYQELRSSLLYIFFQFHHQPFSLLQFSSIFHRVSAQHNNKIHLLFIATINNFFIYFYCDSCEHTWAKGRRRRHWDFLWATFLLLLPLINNKILDWKMTLTAEKKERTREYVCGYVL